MIHFKNVCASVTVSFNLPLGLQILIYLIYPTRATFLAHLPLLEPIIVIILGEAKLTDCTDQSLFSSASFTSPTQCYTNYYNSQATGILSSLLHILWRNVEL